jgi:cobalt-zinc-cadmium efflux system membrane fusion protein
MKILNKYISVSVLGVSLALFTSCGNNKPEPGVGKEKAVPAKEVAAKEEHEEGEGMIASLTADQVKAVGVESKPIEKKELTATIKANGTLTVPNQNKANITSLFGGVVQGLQVQVGDYVRKGQTIATITNPEFLNLQEEYLGLSSKITYAEQELDRQELLNNGNAGALKNKQSAVSELRTLKARELSLKRQIQMMGINPNSIGNGSLQSMLVVKSPINGTVSNVFAKIGSYVDVSSPLAEVVDNSQIHLDLQVFEKDLPKVRVNQVIRFTITNNPQTEYQAKIFSIGSSFNNESKSIAVHALVTGNKGGLIDGMNVTGVVGLDNVSSWAVPNEAVVDADGKYYIFILTDKTPEEHEEVEEEGHDHGNEGTEKHDEGKVHKVNYEKIEISKGVSNLGYTAIIPVRELPVGTKVITKGAFFINATLSESGGHAH